jgi:hypothetical protein
MKRNKRLLFVGLGILCLTCSVYVSTMVLMRKGGYVIRYTYQGVAYDDGVVYGRWLDSENQYLHLPHSDLHPWWRMNVSKQMLQSLNRPAQWGPFWWMGTVPLGVGIDFDVKIGHWDWRFEPHLVRFANADLTCEVELP